MYFNHPHLHVPSRLVSHQQVPPNVPFVEPLGSHNGEDLTAFAASF